MQPFQLRQLSYRCRRGTRELESLLLSYLERHYQQASAPQQRLFESLLKIEDDALWDWIQEADSDAKMPVEERLAHAIKHHTDTST